MIKIENEYYFLCDECPLLPKKNLEHRLELKKEFGEFQFDHLGCDKIGCHFFIGDYCEDAFAKIPMKKKKGKRMSGLAYRRAMNEKKKKYEIKIATTGFKYHWARYIDYDFVNGSWKAVGKYVKRPKNSNKQKFYKKYSNHIIRQGAKFGSGKSGYKRCFDYKWEIE